MNFYTEDTHLQKTLKKHLTPSFYTWAHSQLTEFGSLCANEIDERAVHTDREGQPKLIKYDKFGDDISTVWVNSGYKQTIADTYNRGIVGYVHKPIPDLGHSGNYFYSYAQGYLLSMAEPGFYCPVTLSMATAYVVDHFADDTLKKQFLPHLLSTGDVELFEGATFLTERQGGSDVGANETKAIKHEDHYLLYGEKYFASNAGTCGAAIVLARMEGAPAGTKGLSLFLVPWRQQDGSTNHLRIRRLKDKLGVKAVPSAEVEFDGTKAYVIGAPDKGFYYMMEALNLSRVSNAVASLGIMRRALVEAKNYAFKRDAFGKKIARFPMIQEKLVSLTARQEVQTSATFDLIALFDTIMSEPETAKPADKVLLRLLIALIKKKTAEESIDFAHEAIEMHGGNGYIEDFVTPRLLRDAQVLTVWEGTANILGLEVLRLINKYAVHHIFIDMMNQRLAQLPAYLQGYTKDIHEAITRLSDAIHYLSGQNDDVQTYHIKRIAELMTNIYYSVIALEDASNNQKRSELIARVMLDHLWKHDIIDKDMIAVNHFDLLVAHKATEPIK